MGISRTVADLRHPAYDDSYRNWQLWRDTYQGGQRYIDRYLQKFSTRETQEDYSRRILMTYNPAFAKNAVDEVKNSIFQRLVDISRHNGSETYQLAVRGLNGGVDLLGSSMDSFIGRKLLPELLTMSRVGVYVDMPQISGVTMADAKGARPYIYAYRTEDVTNWSYDEASNTNEFSNILLREYFDTYDSETGLPVGTGCRYRRMWLGDGGVYLQFYDDAGQYTTIDNEKSGKDESLIFLNISKIPFMIVELSSSLLVEAAKYQVALLNLASSDISYALSANFPFYTEMYEPRGMNEFQRKPGPAQGGETPDAAAAKTEEVKVGVTRGRRYPKGMDRPGFINPSSEPLKASMEKQEQMKSEIKQLVNLAVTNLTPMAASAASKGMDRKSLESGLSYIGLELENMERKIAEYWSMYERKPMATIDYPTNYATMTDEDRRTEAADLIKLLPIIPSRTFQRAVAKRIAELTVGRQVSVEALAKIMTEVDNSEAVTVDPTVIAQDVEFGILDKELAAKLKGYPAGTVEKANTEHADRLARIAKSQSKGNEMVNGVSDLSGSGGSDPKINKDTNSDPVKDRGVGKNNQGE